MKVLILTGPAAAGKNTIADILAQKREKCAVIDVDLVRWMYRHPHKAPWEGEEGKHQQILGIKNTVIIAKNFLKNEINAIILDVLTDETAKLYKELLPEAKIALLMPSYEVAYKRYTQRPRSIREEEFKTIYTWQEKLSTYDEKIDNSSASAEKVAQRLNNFIW